MAQLDWLGAASAAVNEDPAFRGLGSAELVLGVKSGDIVRIVSFDAFAVTEVADADDSALRDCEVVIEMTPAEWSDYLKGRAAGTGPSLLSLDLDRGVVRALDPLRRLKFERYHLTLQALVDQGAKVVDAERPQPVALRRDTELGQGALS